MKRSRAFAVIAVLALLALALTACGKSEFGVTDNTGKQMTITAEKAARDAFFLTGSLEVAEGERIEVASALTKGLIRVELVRQPEEQSIDKLPELDGEASLTVNAGGAESSSGTVPAGDYWLRATCLEKATGTVRIEVTPAA